MLEQFWKGVAGTLTAVFKNQPKDRLATVIPVSGTLQKGDVDVWSAALALLKNAFVRALLPRIDHEMTLQELKAKDDEARDGNGPEAQSPRAASQAK